MLRSPVANPKKALMFAATVLLGCLFMAEMLQEKVIEPEAGDNLLAEQSESAPAQQPALAATVSPADGWAEGDTPSDRDDDGLDLPAYTPPSASPPPQVDTGSGTEVPTIIPETRQAPHI